MGCGIIHWNPGFCKEGQGGFVGFRALRASGRGNCVRFCGRPRGPPLRLYVGDLSETWRAGLGPAPTADKETVIPFCRGRSQTGPREGHTPGWLLSAFGRFTFSPSPTGFKDTFRVWAGGPLEAPAVDDSGKKVTLIRLTYARHLPPPRGKARAADSRPYKGERNLIQDPARATARAAPTAFCV